MSGLALIAGQGRLPALLATHLTAAGRPPRILALDGFDPDDLDAESFRLEHLGTVLAGLRAEGIDEVVFAGAVRRPRIDPARIDALTAPLIAGIATAMGQGDDRLLRTIIAVFETAGLAVRGPADLMPGLTAGPGPLTGTPAAPLIADAARARAIIDALGPLDVGQAAVVSGGHCLGIETIQGTAALLAFVAGTRTDVGGVLVKRPKPGQDLRIDMPVIGPDTVAAAAAAGLEGIAIAAGAVMILDRPAVLAAAEAEGLAIWAEP